eukprot:1185945-Prorocentrum_minimum.AAC.6
MPASNYGDISDVGYKAHLNLNLVEGLAVVHSDDATDHLGNDDHVTQVSADGIGLLASGSLALLLGAKADC